MGQRNDAIQVIAIHPKDTDVWWERIKPYVEQALEYSLGEMSADHVKERIKGGETLALLFFRGEEIISVVTAELVEYPLMKVCNIHTAAGHDIDDWLDEWWRVITAVAKEQGADRISVAGRKGWEKKLNKYGFQPAYTVLSRSL